MAHSSRGCSARSRLPVCYIYPDAAAAAPTRPI
jgi:hypothetical protein